MFKSDLPIIAVVDSGIGGVSILKQIIEKFKTGNFIYYADNLNMPYGNKTKAFIRHRMDEIIFELKEKYKCNDIIIACNTASSSINNKNYRNVHTLKFSKNKTYLTTPLTKKNLLGYNVISDSNLARQIEKHLFNSAQLEKICKSHINKLKLDNYKNLVLGCTHYELVANLFKKYSKQTNIELNSKQILKMINRRTNNYKELNIVVLLSNKSISYENKIYKLINT